MTPPPPLPNPYLPGLSGTSSPLLWCATLTLALGAGCNSSLTRIEKVEVESGGGEVPRSVHHVWFDAEEPDDRHIAFLTEGQVTSFDVEPADPVDDSPPLSRHALWVVRVRTAEGGESKILVVAPRCTGDRMIPLVKRKVRIAGAFAPPDHVFLDRPEQITSADASVVEPWLAGLPPEQIRAEWAARISQSD